MPITFPCDRCTGTLSIAKRKAYALVDCPKCGCKQVVPGESRPGRAKVTANGTPVAEPPLFERADFENLLNPTTKKSADPTASAPIVTVPESLRTSPAAAVAAPAASDSVPARPPLDLVPLRRVHLVLAAVLVAVLLALTFGVGVLVGQALTATPAA